MFNYYILALLVQLGLAVNTLSIALKHGTFALEEQQHPKLGSSWAGNVTWPDKRQRSRSVQDCQYLAGNITEAVMIAVKADETSKSGREILGIPPLKDRISTRGFSGRGNLLFSVFTHPGSSYAFVASVPRSRDAKIAAWGRIHSKAPSLNQAIDELEPYGRENPPQLHGEEVAFSLFEESRPTNKETPFTKSQTYSKRPADSTYTGYPAGSVVGSWKLTKTNYEKQENGKPRSACEPDLGGGSIIHDNKKRTACTIISNEPGVRTVATDPDPVAGSETAKLRGDEPVPKKPKPSNDCDEGPSTGVRARANSCPLPVKGNSKLSAAATATASGQSSRRPAASAKHIASAKPVFSGKPVISRHPAASSRPTSGKGNQGTGQRTTMKTLVREPKTAAPTKANRPYPTK